MKYANLLMDDLLALDSMVGLSQQARPLKKEQVNAFAHKTKEEILIFPLYFTRC